MEDLFLRGIEEFNKRDFFEAHDSWEEVWREITGPDKIFYQGLIQTTVGFYHLSNKNYRGACSQLGKAATKLEQFLPSFLGVNTLALVEHVRLCLADAEHFRDGAEGLFDESKIPLIEWSS